jgi:uncharacterized protein involved in outer membrane biogenesis
MRRFFVIILVVLLLLTLLVVAFGAWALHNEDFLKGQVSRIVAAQTGRQLSIEGPLQLELGRQTTLTAGGISFANAAWAQEPALASAESLYVSIDIPALFDSAVWLPELRLADCSVNLQKNDNGQANWELAGAGDEQPAEPDSDWTFRMDELDIDRCRLSLDGPKREKPLLVEIDLARLGRENGTRVSGEIDGRLDGEALSVKGWMDPPWAFGEGGPVSMELVVTTGDFALDLSTSFTDAALLSGPELDGRFHGPEIGVILDHFALPPVSEGDFDFRVRLKADGGRSVIDVDGDLGSLEMHAEGEIDRLAEPTSGQVSAAVRGPDLEALGQALGLDAPLGKAFEFEARLAFAPGAIRFEQASLQTADEQAEISGTLSRAPQLAGTELSVTLQSRDVSRWLQFAGLAQSPSGALSLESKVNVDDGGELLIDGSIEHAGASLEAKGALGPLTKPVVPDLDLALRSNDLSLLGPILGTDSLPSAPIDLSGHVKRNGDELALSGVVLKLAENSATIDGSLELDRLFEDFDLRAGLDIADLAEFGKLFDKPDLPAGPMQISGTLARDGKELRFAVNDGDLGDIKIDLDGHIADLDQPTHVDATFELDFPSTRTVATWLPGLLLPEGPMSATGQLRNLSDRTRVDDVRLRVARTEASVDGYLGHDQSFELKIGFSGPDLSELQELAGISFPALPFDLSTGIAGNPQDMAFRDLYVRMGESEAQGDLRYEHGATRRITGTLAGRHIDLTHWIQAEQADDEREAEEAARRFVFDDTPVLQWSDLGWEANVRATAEELAIANGRYTNLDIGFLLEGSRAEVNPFEFTAKGGGQFRGELLIEGDSGVPTLDFRLDAKNYPLQLLGAEGQDPSTLPIARFVADLRGRGMTHREMAESLEGKIRLNVGPGNTAPSSAAFLFSDFLINFFKILLPWSESYEYTRLECAVAAADVHNGKLKLDPLVINTQQVTIISEGKIDLETERIDVVFNSKQRKGLGISASDLVNPFIKIGGTLAAPAIELDPTSTVVKGGLAVATMGISILANSLADRYLSSKDPCGDAQKAIDKRDAKSP